MNSPEEKAAALVNKFMEWTPAEEELELLYAKKAAEACVDEIIAGILSIIGSQEYMWTEHQKDTIVNYRSVKESIQKL